MEETARTFVDRMLESGNDWMSILSVSRCVRGGRWRKEAQRILEELGMMPTDKEVIRKAYEKEFEERAKSEAIKTNSKKRRKRT